MKFHWINFEILKIYCGIHIRFWQNIAMCDITLFQRKHRRRWLRQRRKKQKTSWSNCRKSQHCCRKSFWRVFIKKQTELTQKLRWRRLKNLVFLLMMKWMKTPLKKKKQWLDKTKILTRIWQHMKSNKFKNAD